LETGDNIQQGMLVGQHESRIGAVLGMSYSGSRQISDTMRRLRASGCRKYHNEALFLVNKAFWNDALGEMLPPPHKPLIVSLPLGNPSIPITLLPFRRQVLKLV